jgi:hypothetical protein
VDALYQLCARPAPTLGERVTLQFGNEDFVFALPERSDDPPFFGVRTPGWPACALVKSLLFPIRWTFVSSLPAWNPPTSLPLYACLAHVWHADQLTCRGRRADQRGAVRAVRPHLLIQSGAAHTGAGGEHCDSARALSSSSSGG